MGIDVDRQAMIENVSIEIPETVNLTAGIAAAEWFKANDPKGQVGFFGRLFNKEARAADTAIERVTVNGKRPDSVETFDQLLRVARYRLARQATADAWNRLAERAQCPAFDTFGANPAKTLVDRYGTTLSVAATWWHQTFFPLYQRGLRPAFMLSPLKS